MRVHRLFRLVSSCTLVAVLTASCGGDVPRARVEAASDNSPTSVINRLSNSNEPAPELSRMKQIRDREQRERVEVLRFLVAAVDYGVAAAEQGRRAKSAASRVGVTRVAPTPAAVSAQSSVGGGAETAGTSAPRRRVSSVIPDELVPFFECVLDHESAGAGLYAAVNPSGKYRGAFQMDRSFWRSHAPAEWKHLADTGNWETAPPEVQDQTALTGYHNQGPQAWSGPGGAICREFIR